MKVENLFEGKGGYVFVSHSHLDIEKVRKIRNFLEDEGMEPILFYLRCMDDGDEGKLLALKKLIFDEIDSREFFLYVNSENAASSAWVQEELAHIRATHPDRITVINISDNDIETEKMLSRMVRGMRIFISASRAECEIVERLTDALTALDFRVYDVKNLLCGGDLWSDTVSHTMTDLAGEGFVIALVTKSSVRSRFFVEELRTALDNKVPILPVVVGDTYMLQDLFDDLPELQGLDLEMLSSDPTDEELTKVVNDAIQIQKGFFG